jgi:phospholipid/cholesterol/gamma-HCH transport system substrate-binding protein
MQKQAPSAWRIVLMGAFALSCIGLLLFLWLSFGGSIPLAPQGYRVKVALPAAAQLAKQADVRISGVSVGKVVDKELSPTEDRTVATLELQSRFAPLHRDARAILRQKTLLGETYVELAPGSAVGGDVPDGGTLPSAHVRPSVQLDDIFDALDPGTRAAFRIWQRDLAGALRHNGANLNNVLGNLPAFARGGDNVLTVLDVEHVALGRLVRDTGTVFAALSRDPARLRALIRSSEAVFSQTARQNVSLAETFAVLPTFLDESKATFARLDTFARDTDPLVRELRPVARELSPTLADLRRLAPPLRSLFVNLGPLIAASQRGLPAVSSVLRGATPLLAQVGPFLSQLNPVLNYLELNQHLLADFIAQPGSAQAAKFSGTTGTGHYLRQFSPVAVESLGFFAKQTPTNRRNSYLPPLALNLPDAAKYLAIPSWSCQNSAARAPHGPTATEGGCWVAPPGAGPGYLPGKQKFPHVTATSYR